MVLIPKKNGKSTLVAAVALHHLLSTPFANCIIVAAARHQAEIVLDQARMFIRQSQALRSRMRVLRREIVSTIDGGKIQVLASDVDNADGQLPTLAIVDELHRQKSLELFTVLRLGLSARKGRMIVISTAGAQSDSPLGQLRTRAYEMPGFTRDAKRRHSSVRSKDGRFWFLEWCLNADDDPSDLKLVKLVNPRPGRTIEDLATDKEDVPAWEFLRLCCGIWTEGEEPAIPPELFDPLADANEIPEGSAVWLGVALGLRSVGSSVVAVHRDGDRIDAEVEILTHASTYQEVEAVVASMRSRYDVRGLVYTSKGFDYSADLIRDGSLDPIRMPWSEQRAEKASATFWKLLEEKTFHHSGDATLRAHVMGATVKETAAGGWRFESSPSRPTAALFALAAACDQMLSVEAPPLVSVGWL